MLCIKGRLEKRFDKESAGTGSVFWDKDTCFI